MEKFSRLLERKSNILFDKIEELIEPRLEKVVKPYATVEVNDDGIKNGQNVGEYILTFLIEVNEDHFEYEYDDNPDNIVRTDTSIVTSRLSDWMEGLAEEVEELGFFESVECITDSEPDLYEFICTLKEGANRAGGVGLLDIKTK